MSQTLSYRNVRDLLTGMSYKRGNTGVASRTYTYDAAGRPIIRNASRNGQAVNDSFAHGSARQFLQRRKKRSSRQTDNPNF